MRGWSFWFVFRWGWCWAAAFVGVAALGVGHVLFGYRLLLGIVPILYLLRDGWVSLASVFDFMFPQPAPRRANDIENPKKYEIGAS